MTHPPTPFEEMLRRMEHSVFCLVVAGDAQSTRRLTEIFMAGCIPVFIGPPYNSMPLAEEINWQQLGVFFNVTQHQSWMLAVSSSRDLPVLKAGVTPWSCFRHMLTSAAASTTSDWLTSCSPTKVCFDDYVTDRHCPL